MEESPKHFYRNSVVFGNEVEQNRISRDVDVIKKNNDNAITDLNDVDDNLMGRMVNSENEAYDLYNEYAIKKGFSVRRSKTRYVFGKFNTKEIRSREFRCSKAGPVPETSSSSKVYRNEFVTKSDCKAMIRFKNEDGLWTVNHFVAEHNHELASPSESYLLRSNKSMIAPKVNFISSMLNVGVRTKDVCDCISWKVGGNENDRFIKRDCNSEIGKENIHTIEAGDAQSLIICFKKKEATDSMFSYDIQVDQENRLTNFFWRDGKSAVDYDFFGDVVIFDTTYRKNRYDLLCAPFIGLNHHRQNIMFGCAFLLDETIESFVWLFKSFLNSMGGKAPKTIFTDHDQAISNAIEIVFPDTCHLLCSWQMEKHFPSHLGGLHSNPEFQNFFKKCLCGYESESEFQDTWEKMLDEFGLKEHDWLQELYTLRNKWSIVLSNGTFSGGLLSTQIDSTNSILEGLANRTTSLTQFFIGFEKMVASWRSNEAKEDFRCKKGKPHLSIKNCGILNHAADVYTHKNFKLFEGEFMDAIGLIWLEISCVDNVYMFEVKEAENSKVSHVRLDLSTMEISCSCKKFESSGLLCCHVLKIMIVKNFDSIPKEYILNRWGKEARNRWVKCETTEVKGSGDDIKIVYRNKMIRFAYYTILESQINEVTRAIVQDGLQQIHKDVQAELDKSSISPNEKGREDESFDEQDELPEINSVPILDFPRVEPKGVSNDRFKGHSEKQKTKATMGVKGRTIEKKKASTDKSTKQKVLLPKYTHQYPFPSSTNPFNVPPNMNLLNPYGVRPLYLNVGNVPYAANIVPQNTNQKDPRSLPCTQGIQPTTPLSQNFPQSDVPSSKER